MKINALFLAAILLAGCASAPTPEPSLANTDWKLADIDGTPVDPAVEATVSFGNGSISGKGGCNGFNGGYSVSGGTLTVVDLASTKMACPDPQMSTETSFLGALGSGGTVTIGQDTLEIKTFSGATLHFTPQ